MNDNHLKTTLPILYLRKFEKDLQLIQEVVPHKVCQRLNYAFPASSALAVVILLSLILLGGQKDRYRQNIQAGHWFKLGKSSEFIPERTTLVKKIHHCSIEKRTLN